MIRHCFACDLVDDPILISEYEAYHQRVWPGILQSIHQSGITEMEIYRVGDRLFMIMEVTDKFSFDTKARADAANTVVQDWENLMWTYQQALPVAKPGEKWLMMEKIFSLPVAGNPAS